MVTTFPDMVFDWNDCFLPHGRFQSAGMVSYLLYMGQRKGRTDHGGADCVGTKV